MPEDMSPGEVGRTLQRIELTTDALKKGFDGWREIVIRLEHQVQENSKDIATLQQDRDKDAENRRVDRRMIFKSLIAPIVVSIILGGGAFAATVWLALNGGPAS